MSEMKCPTCGESEPGTGNCGTSDSDTKALCKVQPECSCRNESQECTEASNCRVLKMFEPTIAAVAQEPVTVLPDGSAFSVMSFPLPKDHWLYAERQYLDGECEPVELGKPILTHAVRDAVIAAVRYAVRGATNCGKEVDFDPDALVQNAVYALCGPYSKPKPKQNEFHTPAVAQPPAEVVRELVEAAQKIVDRRRRIFDKSMHKFDTDMNGLEDALTKAKEHGL